MVYIRLCLYEWDCVNLIWVVEHLLIFISQSRCVVDWVMFQVKYQIKIILKLLYREYDIWGGEKKKRKICLLLSLPHNVIMIHFIFIGCQRIDSFYYNFF